jgi:hypothetical protein
MPTSKVSQFSFHAWFSFFRYPAERKHAIANDISFVKIKSVAYGEAWLVGRDIKE